eukprot:m.26285 g.26285  ORF g.26285 m.26285 type:complete len:135 (+) comp29213_c0_seq8:42-446(+)
MAAKSDVEIISNGGTPSENGPGSGASDQEENSSLHKAEPAESKTTGWKRKCEKALKQMRLIQQQMTEEKKRRNEAVKERDSMRNDLSRANLAKGRLESLCRELQKHNKAVKVGYVCRTHSLVQYYLGRPDMTNG